MKLPFKFNDQGVLDPETYIATFAEIERSILIDGDGSSKTWDKNWRVRLLKSAKTLLQELWDEKVFDIYLDGSFVENKDHPNDIDGYFDPHLNMYDSTDMKKFEALLFNLNNRNPHKVWNWDPSSRRQYKGIGKMQLPMWHIYRVELYPHLNQGTGITDKWGYDLKFPSAFRQSRSNFQPKGIVKVIP